VTYCPSARECITAADLAVIMNAEPEFRRLRPDDFLKLMRSPTVLDTRRIYSPKEFIGKVRLFSVGGGVQAR
jgi:UDPglucose 6-dehydrogenase